MSEAAPRPWGDQPDSGSFGQWLRRQREVREIGLREIAETSKISIRYLEALEQDRFDLLPAPVFAKGFLREYSKFVGLDPDEVVNFFLSALPEERSEEEKETAVASQRNFLAPLLIVLAVLLAAAAGLSFLANRGARGRQEIPPMAPPVAVESKVATGTEDAAPQPAPIRLTLDFNQNSWIEVYVDGERRVSELRVQGESLGIEAQREVRLTLGNAAGVGFELNGQPFAPKAVDGVELRVDLASVQRLGAP